MSRDRNKTAHRTTVAKRNLFGSRLWWATCTCRSWYQGCSYKRDAERMAAEHLVNATPEQPPLETAT